jgi:hypothetical protein
VSIRGRFPSAGKTLPVHEPQNCGGKQEAHDHTNDRPSPNLLLMVGQASFSAVNVVMRHAFGNHMPENVGAGSTYLAENCVNLARTVVHTTVSIMFTRRVRARRARSVVEYRLRPLASAVIVLGVPRSRGPAEAGTPNARPHHRSPLGHRAEMIS